MWDARGCSLWRKPHLSEHCGASTSPCGSASPRRGPGQLDGMATQQGGPAHTGSGWGTARHPTVLAPTVSGAKCRCTVAILNAHRFVQDGRSRRHRAARQTVVTRGRLGRPPRRYVVPNFAQQMQDWELVLICFTVFSRFDYPLKHSSHLRGNDDRVEPDRARFAGSRRWRFAAVRPERFQQAMLYLKHEPPMKQIVIAKDRRWKPNTPRPGWSEERDLLRLVRTVRKN